MPINEPAPSSAALWTGRVMSAIVILFLIFDAAIKLIPIAPVIDSLAELGYPATSGIARGLGVITLACALLYAWPRTRGARRHPDDAACSAAPSPRT